MLVDLDPQGSVGFSLKQGDLAWTGLAEHLVGRSDLNEVLFQTKLPTLSLLPRGRLDAMDVPRYEAALQGSGVIDQVVKALSSRFEYILLDPPSGLGGITQSALRNSDQMIPDDPTR